MFQEGNGRRSFRLVVLVSVLIALALLLITVQRASADTPTPTTPAEPTGEEILDYYAVVFPLVLVVILIVVGLGLTARRRELFS